MEKKERIPKISFSFRGLGPDFTLDYLDVMYLAFYCTAREHDPYQTLRKRLEAKHGMNRRIIRISWTTKISIVRITLLEKPEFSIPSQNT